MANTDNGDDDAEVFMAKWEIANGFCQLDAWHSEEWNAAHILTQEEGSPVKLVVPQSLQMGSVEYPAYI